MPEGGRVEGVERVGGGSVECDGRLTSAGAAGSAVVVDPVLNACVEVVVGVLSLASFTSTNGRPAAAVVASMMM